jgi:hypothetical protein
MVSEGYRARTTVLGCNDGANHPLVNDATVRAGTTDTCYTLPVAPAQAASGARYLQLGVAFDNSQRFVYLERVRVQLMPQWPGAPGRREGMAARP